MKGVRCSWVDMQKVRASLSNGKRGDQKHLEQLRCVDKTTVSTWKATADLMDLLDGIVDLSQLSSFQPTHARFLTRHLRKRYGKGRDTWNVDDAAVWVDLCEANAYTVEQFAATLKASLQSPVVPPADSDPCCTVDDLAKLTAGEQKFGCIYADPPWSYGNQGTRAATDNHYRTMTVEEITALPVGDLAADESHLHLWTTNGFLREALAILDAWGFEFKSTFIWVKPQLGIGNYWRCSHEIMLLGVRGGLTFPPSGVKSWVEADRTKHSAKPDKIRELIERMSPEPRLELFGRKTSPGWVVWGNEIERGMFTGEVRRMP